MLLPRLSPPKLELLNQLSTSETTIINYSCENAKKFVAEAGIIYAEELTISIEGLQKATNVEDIHRVDLELDHLRSLDLIRGGMSFAGGSSVRITPSPLALNMYVRCQGSLQSPIDYFCLNQD